MSSNQTRTRFARAAVLAASVVVAIVSCSTENLEQERQSVASAALKAGEMPTLDSATIVFAEQLGSREPDYSIVAKLNQPSLTAFISSAALNQARSRSVTDAAADSISGTLPPANLDALLDRADVRSFEANDFDVINDRVGSTYRIFNYACRDSQCVAVIIVSTT